MSIGRNGDSAANPMVRKKVNMKRPWYGLTYFRTRLKRSISRAFPVISLTEWIEMWWMDIPPWSNIIHGPVPNDLPPVGLSIRE